MHKCVLWMPLAAVLGGCSMFDGGPQNVVNRMEEPPTALGALHDNPEDHGDIFASEGARSIERNLGVREPEFRLQRVIGLDGAE